jgi:hypothetical protein
MDGEGECDQMHTRLKALTGRRDDPFPDDLKWKLRDRPFVHVLSGVRTGDIDGIREAQAIRFRHEYMSANFCCVVIVFDGLDGYQCDEADVGPHGFDKTVLTGLWTLCDFARCHPTILTRYNAAAQEVIDAHVAAALEGKPPALIILCPDRRVAEWRA